LPPSRVKRDPPAKDEERQGRQAEKKQIARPRSGKQPSHAEARRRGEKRQQRFFPRRGTNASSARRWKHEPSDTKEEEMWIARPKRKRFTTKHTKYTNKTFSWAEQPRSRFFPRYASSARRWKHEPALRRQGAEGNANRARMVSRGAAESKKDGDYKDAN